jgi:hypothetical protein
MIKLWLFQWRQFEQVTQGHHDILLLIQWDDALQRPLCLPILTHRRNRHPKAFLLSHAFKLARNDKDQGICNPNPVVKWMDMVSLGKSV